MSRRGVPWLSSSHEILSFAPSNRLGCNLRVVPTSEGCQTGKEHRIAARQQLWPGVRTLSSFQRGQRLECASFLRDLLEAPKPKSLQRQNPRATPIPSSGNGCVGDGRHRSAVHGNLLQLSGREEGFRERRTG